jgi:hypothetical protein
MCGAGAPEVAGGSEDGTADDGAGGPERDEGSTRGDAAQVGGV